MKALFFSRRIDTTRLLTCLGAISVLLLLIPVHTLGQDISVISGTVIDKSGAAVAGAKVVVTNAAGNLTIECRAFG